MSSRAGSGAEGQAGRRYAVSPLLVHEEVPPAARDVVEVTTDYGDELLAVLVELNLRAAVDPESVRELFLHEVLPAAVGDGALADRPAPIPVSTGYVRCLLRRTEIPRLLATDARHGVRTVFRVWPDYVLRPQVDRSAATVKADVAFRAYGAAGRGVVWAVADTGIDARHPHFGCGTLSDPEVAPLHADFSYIVRNEPPPAAPGGGSPLTDEDGHGTHVAGIIAGRLPDGTASLLATQQPGAGDASPDPDRRALPEWGTRVLEDGRSIAGMAPLARLVSLKVMDSGGGVPRTTSSAVIAALEHIRRVNAWGRLLRIHGVNLSLGCPWFPSDYAAGQSPLCRELDLLVGTGVVAVVSAGNSGYATALRGENSEADPRGVLSTITDPGNAACAITVGSTHRDRPHTYGVSYTSSKGPTLDGRLKPDLVAPGERITSCAAGQAAARNPVFAALSGDPKAAPTACYTEDSGTSMAAPHVSGVIAAFLSVRQEFIGLPEEVKRLFCETAISLGRDRFFEGHGLVDLMGALAKV